MPGETTSTWPSIAIRPGPRAGQRDGQAPQLVARRLLPGVVRVGAEHVQVVLVQVGFQPERRRLFGEPLERRALVAGHARNLQERRGVADQSVHIESHFGASLVRPSLPKPLGRA